MDHFERYPRGTFPRSAASARFTKRFSLGRRPSSSRVAEIHRHRHGLNIFAHGEDLLGFAMTRSCNWRQQNGDNPCHKNAVKRPCSPYRSDRRTEALDFVKIQKIRAY